MKRTNNLLFYIFIAFIFYSCEDTLECFKSTGDDITEEREISNFDKIILRDNVDLYIEYGFENKCTVTAGSNLIDDIKTDVKFNTLHIENHNSCNWVRSFKNKYRVTLTLDTLSFLEYRGIGDIIFTNFFRVDTFRIEAYDGWGSIRLNYKGDYLRFIHHKGGVDFHANGEVDDYYMYLAGNGFADCSALSTRMNHIWNLSTGNAHINVTENLLAKISYHGNVYYRGQPNNIDLTLESKGRLIPE